MVRKTRNQNQEPDNKDDTEATIGLTESDMAYIRENRDKMGLHQMSKKLKGTLPSLIRAYLKELQANHGELST